MTGSVYSGYQHAGVLVSGQGQIGKSKLLSASIDLFKKMEYNLNTCMNSPHSMI